MILTTTSKHVTVAPHLILIKNKSEVRQITSKRKKFLIPEMISGKYTFLVKLMFLKPSGLDAELIFKYKLGMHKGEKALLLKQRGRSVKFLNTSLEYITPDYLQLSLANAFGKQDVVIKALGLQNNRLFLKPQEMHKIIIKRDQLQHYSVSYQIKGNRNILPHNLQNIFTHNNQDPPL